MKKKIMYSLAVLVCGLLMSSLAEAGWDCSGSFIPPPPGYNGRGGYCAFLGLNTNAGVCQPGQEYETLCDDAPQGYKVCSGPRRCIEDRGRGDRGRNNRDNDCRGWDFSYDQPCPRGYINDDCRGGCEPN